MARAPKTTAPQTTAQRLDSIVKSARKIMRKVDEHCSGNVAHEVLGTAPLLIREVVAAVGYEP